MANTTIYNNVKEIRIMKKIVFSIMTFVMFGSSLCMGKVLKETNDVQPREEQIVRVPAQKGQSDDSRQLRTKEKHMGRKDRKAMNARVKRREVTVSMQTLRF